MPALADALAIGAEINRAYRWKPVTETNWRPFRLVSRLVSRFEYTVGGRETVAQISAQARLPLRPFARLAQVQQPGCGGLR